MHLITDRPSNGVRALIEFSWGAPGDLVPYEVLVTVANQILCSASGPWKCFADALRHSIEMATAWCGRHH